MMDNKSVQWKLAFFLVFVSACAQRRYFAGFKATYKDMTSNYTQLPWENNINNNWRSINYIYFL